MLLVSTLFIVDQRQFAVVYALGEIKEVIIEPGLKFKLPPPFQNVVFLDRRIQTLDSPETAADLHRREEEPGDRLAGQVAHHRPAPVHPQQRRRHAQPREPAVARSCTPRSTRRSPSAPSRGVLSTERDKVMQDVRSRLADEAKSFGIEILDVRIKRVDFVANITESIYRRMASERKQVANQLRSTGAAEGEKIRADADRQREVIVAT